MPDYREIAHAFDVVAGDYDAVYGSEGNAVMTWMRRESLALLYEAFPLGSHLLEIGCGTGEEAVALAQAGRRVLATDISPQMAARTQAKAQDVGVKDRVTALAAPGSVPPPAAGLATGAGRRTGRRRSLRVHTLSRGA